MLSRIWNRKWPRRRGQRRRRLGCFEQLESRVVLSTAGPIADRPYIDLGTSDNVAWDQPRVTVEFLTDAAGSGSVGPAVFNSWLLDTGANSVMAFASAVSDMKDPPHVYRTEGTFEELGVGGTHLFDISAAYRWDFAGKSGNRNTLLNTRILSDENTELSILGPRGIVGMPAMADRVTTWDYSGWTHAELEELFMGVDFSDTLPPDNGHRLSVTVDNRVEFSPDAYVRSGGNPPVWADIPFMTGQLKHNGLVAEGNLLLDSGAQISVMSSKLATQLGLDSNHDGALNERDANFARFETVGGVGGTKTAPVFLFDEVHIPTQQGPDLVWTELQWLVLDIIEGIDGVFGFDNMTSGWIEAFPVDGKSGYFMKNHLDFRNWNATGTGTLHFDLNPEVHQVIDPLGPGARVVEPGRWTSVSEIGVQDTYEIALTQPPQSDVRIQLTNSEGQLTAVADADPARDYLIFTPQNWNVPQKVRVSAVDDGQAENFHRSSIRHVSTSSDPAYAGVGMPRVIVNIIDDDFPGMMIIPSGGATEVAESGQSDTYQVVLTMAPQEDVSIELENVGGQVLARGQISGTNSLVFTPQNWNVPQTVNVTAVDDQVLEGDHNTYINHRINTSDSRYSEAFPLQEFVTIAENDFADFGDAPDPYPTLLGRNGARHLALGPTLGTARDHEADGQPHAAAAGDDALEIADEDGVTLPSTLQPGQTTPLPVNASAAGFLNAWVDFNADGDWSDPGEQVFTNLALGAGVNQLPLTVPSTATITERTFARFRLSTQQGLSYTGLAPDGEVEDYALAVAQPSAAKPLVQIADDGDVAFASQGAWAFYPMGHQLDQRYIQQGFGKNFASWTFAVEPGHYRVSATWPSHPNRATNSPFSVWDGVAHRGTVQVNQELPPDDFMDAGTSWEDLGTFAVYGDQLVVRLSDAADEYVIADAVRIEKVAPTTHIVDDGDAGYATPQGSWLTPSYPSAFAGDISYNATIGGATETATWTFHVPLLGKAKNGQYRIAATWQPQWNLATNATYRIYDGTTAGTLLGSATLDQLAGPDDFTADGATWESLGKFIAKSGMLTIELETASANSYVFADAMRIDHVRDPIIDNGDDGYSTPAGDWVEVETTAYDGDIAWNAAPGGAAESAQWTFDLQEFLLPTAGIYRVSATWKPQWNLATNATYRIYDGTTAGTLLNTVSLNQVPGPDDLAADGAVWEDLGGPYWISSGRVTVELVTDTADSYVFADAVRIEPVRPPIIDNGDEGYATPVGTWHTIIPSPAFGGDIAYNAAPGGTLETATWTFDLSQFGLSDSGTYRVAATWKAQWNLATNAPYRIYDGTTAGILRGSVTVNQVPGPSDFSADGLWWENLGTFVITSGQLTVELRTGTADSYVFADAIWIDKL